MTRASFFKVWVSHVSLRTNNSGKKEMDFDMHKKLYTFIITAEFGKEALEKKIN